MAGFHIMQFNAAVDSNIHALHLYKQLGFTDLGVIPGGFPVKGFTEADCVAGLMKLYQKMMLCFIR